MFVYILQSLKNKRYYIGCTNNLYNRIEQHNKGYNRSTKYGSPWELICFRKFASQEQAYIHEKLVKSYKGGNAFKKIINGELPEWMNLRTAN